MGATSFIRNIHGSISPMFGICIVAVVSIVAVALDYSRVSSAHKQTQNAVDAAMLSALAEVKRLQKLGHSDSSAKSAGLKFAKDSFEYHTKAVHEVVDLAFMPEITFVGTEIHGSSKVTANVELTIAKIMGKEFAPLDLESTVIIGGLETPTSIFWLIFPDQWVLAPRFLTSIRWMRPSIAHSLAIVP